MYETHVFESRMVHVRMIHTKLINLFPPLTHTTPNSPPRLETFKTIQIWFYPTITNIFGQTLSENQLGDRLVHLELDKIGKLSILPSFYVL